MRDKKTIEIQKELFKKGGKFTKYQDLILGERALCTLLKYEMIMGLTSGIPGALGLFLRSKLYPLILGHVGRNVTFGKGVLLRHPKKIIIGNDVVIDDHCVLDAKGSDNQGIVIGNGVFLGRNTILNCQNGDIILNDRVNISANCMVFSASRVTVGQDFLIAAYCYLVGGTHCYDNPCMPVLDQGRISEGITLESGGWLGAHVTIFDGVHLGKHVVIGAGSVVNKNIPDYAIAAGSPVRVIKSRKPEKQGISVKETRKKLLYLSMYDPHVPYTGAGVRGAQLVNFLAHSYEVFLIYMSGSGHPGDPELEDKFKDRIEQVARKIKIPFTQKGYFLLSRSLMQSAEEILREERFDWILADYGLGGYYGVKLSRRFKIPLIYSSHNIEYKQYLGKAKSDFRRFPLVPYVYNVEKRSCKKADIVVSVSDNDASYYTRWINRDKIVVVPQGFDDAVYHPFYDSVVNEPKIVLFFGNYNISTNRDAVETVYKAIVDRVIQKNAHVLFQFVGANPPLHLSHPNFEFVGFVESIVPFIRKADLVISPILKGWGMPTKIVESLACGKPVVATESGARSVSKQYKRLIVCPIDQFPETICEVLNKNRPVDPCDYEALKKEFLWERRLKPLLKMMDRRIP